MCYKPGQYWVPDGPTVSPARALERGGGVSVKSGGQIFCNVGCRLENHSVIQIFSHPFEGGCRGLGVGHFLPSM